MRADVEEMMETPWPWSLAGSACQAACLLRMGNAWGTCWDRCHKDESTTYTVQGFCVEIIVYPWISLPHSCKCIFHKRFCWVPTGGAYIVIYISISNWNLLFLKVQNEGPKSY